MSTGSVDERIRTVLDLGDSSAAVKGLDAEVEKLLAAFQKQTELFEQKKLSPQAYADALHKMRSEVSGLSSAMKELGSGGGGGGGGDGFEGINRRLFALERGVTGLISGSGLNRAGSALEGGIGLLGGPAGLGIMAALVTNTLEHIGPAIKTGLDKLFKGITDEEITERRAALKEEAKQVRAAVTAQEIQPKPGMEYEQVDRDTKLKSIFTGRMAPDLISKRLYEAIRSHTGSTITDKQPEETEALNRLKDQLDPAGAVQRQSTMPYERIVTYWEGFIERAKQAGDPKRRMGIKNEIRNLETTIAQRTADKLILAAQVEGPPGRTARRQLLDLAKRFPGILDPSEMTLLEGIINQEDPKRIKDEMEKLQADQQKAAALEYKGPAPPVYPEFRSDRAGGPTGMHGGVAMRGLAPRLQTGIIPGGQEAADQRKREQERGARGPIAGPDVLPAELGGPGKPRYRRTQSYAGDLDAQQAQYGEALKAAHHSQVEALRLEQLGLATHARTQSVVRSIQHELENVKRQLKHVNRNADDLARKQAKSAQNTTGNP